MGVATLGFILFVLLNVLWPSFCTLLAKLGRWGWLMMLGLASKKGQRQSLHQLTIRHFANGETVLFVAKDIWGHCATVAKRFSERTYRTHPLWSPRVFSFWPRRSCGGERAFAKIGLMERVLLIFFVKKRSSHRSWFSYEMVNIYWIKC